VMPIVSIGKSDEESCVRDAVHEREKPLRLERSFGPRTDPASRMKA
jgi:hypothetical protein